MIDTPRSFHCQVLGKPADKKGGDSRKVCKREEVKKINKQKGPEPGYKWLSD